MKSMSIHTAALLADSINDASSTRKVYLLAAGLALLGVALVVMTVWFWRSTRHDPELLAPLEVMGARRFRHLEGGAQQQALDHSRPADAKPMRWGVVRGEASTDPEIDLRESMRGAPSGFDDLRDPALIAVALESPEGEYVSTPNPGAASGAIEPAAADPVAAVTVAAAAAERDSLAEIDAILAGAATPSQAEVEAEPQAKAEPEPEPEPEPEAKPEAEPEAEPEAKPEAKPEPDAEVAATQPAVPAERARAAAAAPADETAIRTAPEMAPSSPRGSKPGAGRGPQPLVIVPVDHQLRPSPKRVEPAEDSEAADDTAATEQPDTIDEPLSIDPLLRMVNRNDT